MHLKEHEFREIFQHLFHAFENFEKIVKNLEMNNRLIKSNQENDNTINYLRNVNEDYKIFVDKLYQDLNLI